MNTFNSIDRLPAEVISLAKTISSKAAAERQTIDPLALSTKLDFNVIQKGLGYLEDREPLPTELAVRRAGVEGNTWTLQRLPKNIGSLLLREDTGQPLFVVGQRFAIAQNSDIHAAFIEGLGAGLPTTAFDDGVRSAQVTSFEGRFSRVDLTFSGMAYELKQLSGKPTMLNFKAGWSNYHGGGSIKVWAGAEDLICLNGMMGDVMMSDAFRHTVAFTPEHLGGFIRAQAEMFQERCRVWQRWAMAEISPEEAEQVLKDTGNSPKHTKALMEQLDREAAARGMTVWSVYSALTQWSSHATDQFKVRNTGADNVAAVLADRETAVTRIVSSEAWQRFAA